MEERTIIVEGMSCGHCVNAVEKAVGALAGVVSAKVDLGAKTLLVTFDSSKVTLADITEAVEEEGYTVVS